MENCNLENYSNYGGERDLARQAAISSFMTKVYGWMSFALLLTGLMAYAIANSETMSYIILGNRLVFYGLLVVEFGLVITISAAIHKLSYNTLTALFVLYSLINGATLSVIFLVYTTGSITSTFLVCAATFGSMTLFGLVTKKDLSGWGKILILALIGLIIASIVNIFLANSRLDWILNYVGVLIFVGLTAYDTQKLKNLSSEINDENMAKKLSIMGALTLYLDFINLFLYLLKILGKKR